MRIFIKTDAGDLKKVEVFEDNILHLSTGEVESSNFIAHICLDNGPVHKVQHFYAEVNPGMTIRELKRCIETLTNIPFGQQTLMHKGNELEMRNTLQRYGMLHAPVHIDLIQRDLLATPSSESDSS